MRISCPSRSQASSHPFSPSALPIGPENAAGQVSAAEHQTRRLHHSQTRDGNIVRRPTPTEPGSIPAYITDYGFDRRKRPRSHRDTAGRLPVLRTAVRQPLTDGGRTTRTDDTKPGGKSLRCVQNMGTETTAMGTENDGFPPFFLPLDPSRRGHQQQKSVILDLLLVVS